MVFMMVVVRSKLKWNAKRLFMVASLMLLATTTQKLTLMLTIVSTLHVLVTLTLTELR